MLHSVVFINISEVKRNEKILSGTNETVSIDENPFIFGCVFVQIFTFTIIHSYVFATFLWYFVISLRMNKK